MQTWTSRSANVFAGIFVDKWFTRGGNPLEGRGCEEHCNTAATFSEFFYSVRIGFVESWKVIQLFLIKITQKSSNKQGVIAKTPRGS